MRKKFSQTLFFQTENVSGWKRISPRLDSTLTFPSHLIKIRFYANAFDSMVFNIFFSVSKAKKKMKTAKNNKPTGALLFVMEMHWCFYAHNEANKKSNKKYKEKKLTHQRYAITKINFDTNETLVSFSMVYTLVLKAHLCHFTSLFSSDEQNRYLIENNERVIEKKRAFPLSLPIVFE